MTVARVAPCQCLDLNVLADAGKGFLERQLKIVAQVGSARGILPLAARVHEFAEDRREDVGESVEPASRERVAATAAILERGMAKAVVRGALLRILEHFIGLADGLEMRFLLGAAAVAVGMAFHRLASIRGLDCGGVRPAIDAQQFVIIGFSHNRTNPTHPFGLSLSKPCVLLGREKYSPSTSSGRTATCIAVTLCSRHRLPKIRRRPHPRRPEPLRPSLRPRRHRHRSRLPPAAARTSPGQASSPPGSAPGSWC